MDKLEVRQAIAHALNREEVVDTFYRGRGEVAQEFMPPEVFGYADDVTQYEYDPAKSKELLQKAGVLTLPVRDHVLVSDRRVAAVHAGSEAQLRGVLGQPGEGRLQGHAEGGAVAARTTSAPSTRGTAQLYLLGWTGDFGDPDNFIGTFFQDAQKAWGTRRSRTRIFMDLLDKAEAETDERGPHGLYQEANRLIMDFAAGRAVRALQPALAFKAGVEGYEPSPVSLEPFATVIESEELG